VLLLGNDLLPGITTSSPAYANTVVGRCLIGIMPTANGGFQPLH
jgi:hypothetical protein